MKKKLSLSLLATGLVAIGCALVQGRPFGAHAIEAMSGGDSASTHRKAVAVHVTHRGQEYFAHHLNDFIYRVGYSLDSGGFDRWDYEQEDPLRLDSLPVRFANYRGTLAGVRDIVNRWLRNFTFNDPRFAVEISNIGFATAIQHLGMVIDPQLTNRMPPGKGLGVRFTARLGGLRIEAERVTARDVNNPFLGDFGLDQLWAGSSADSVPFEIEIPALFQFTEEGRPKVQVLEVNTNLEAITLAFGFRRPLRLPRVEVEVNGRTMVLNQERLETQLLAAKEQLMKALQAYLEEHAMEKVPQQLNAILDARLPRPFTDQNRMSPPGAPSPVPDSDKLMWGISPASIDYVDQNVHFSFDARIADPRVRRGSLTPPTSPATAAPRLDRLSPSDYDVALSLSQDFVNQLLSLSHRRGYFSAIPISPSETMALVNAPTFQLESPSADPRHAKLHTKIRLPVSGIQSWVVSNPLEFDVDLEVSLTRNARGGIQAAIARVDERSVRIEQRFIRMELFSGKVYRAVRARIRELNAGLARAPKVIADEIPFPSKVAGIPMRIQEISSDSGGHFVIYLSYALNASRNSR